MLGNSLVAAQLATSQEGPISMELVIITTAAAAILYIYQAGLYHSTTITKILLLLCIHNS
jgi:hypothetical protein